MAANVNNYINAANAAIRNNVQMRKTLADNKARLGDIAGEGVMQDAKNRVADAENNLELAKEKMRQEGSDEMFDDNQKTAKEIQDIKQRTNMAGKLAAGAGMMTTAYLYGKRAKEENKELSLLGEQIQLLKDRQNRFGEEVKDIDSEEYTGVDPESITAETMGVKSGPVPPVSALTGNAKILADAIAGPESGPWGYNAFNQGGTDEGRTVLGRSGSYKTEFGRDLTGMTVQQVMDLQFDDKSLTEQQWNDQGKIHAAGRYQFIGPTLRDEVTRMGLDTSRLFDAATQDEIFLSHAKRVGNISPWIGPTDEYNEAEKAYYNSLIPGL